MRQTHLAVLSLDRFRATKMARLDTPYCRHCKNKVRAGVRLALYGFDTDIFSSYNAYRCSEV